MVNRKKTQIIFVLLINTMLFVPFGISEYIPNDAQNNGVTHWHLDDSTNVVDGWDPTDIDKLTNPGKNQIVVAVLDTGIASDGLAYDINPFKWHKYDFNEINFWDDLEVNLWLNPTEPKGDPYDLDGDGNYDEAANDDALIEEQGKEYIDDYCGYDFVDDDGDGHLNEDPINYEWDGDEWIGVNDDNDFYIDVSDVHEKISNTIFNAYRKHNKQEDGTWLETDEWCGYGFDLIVKDNGPNSVGYFWSDDEVLRDLGNLKSYYYWEDTNENEIPDDGDKNLLNDDNALINEDSAYPIATQYNPAASHKEDYHGTSVAGIIGAVLNNLAYKKEVAGICQVSLMPIRVTTQPLYESNDGLIIEKYTEIINLADALHYARTHGADIISMSIGIPDEELDEYVQNGYIDLDATNSELQAAWNDNILLVASSGNDNGLVGYPANSPYVLSVGASSWLQQPTHDPAGWHNSGPDLEIIAPGEKFYSYIGRFNLDGTSLGCPIVSGIAATLLSYRPELTNSEVRTLIQATAQVARYEEGSQPYVDAEFNEDFWCPEGGFGEVNAFYSQLCSQLVQYDWHKLDNVESTVRPSIEYRQKCAIDTRGYTHFVYKDVDVTNADILYNVMTSSGRLLYNNPINVEQIWPWEPSEWFDICVDSSNYAHIVWAERDIFSKKTYLRYSQVDECGNVIPSGDSFFQRGWPTGKEAFFEYLNLMCNDVTDTNPLRLYLVFNERMFNPSSGVSYDYKIKYLEFNVQNNKAIVLEDEDLKYDDEDAITEVSADIGISEYEPTMYKYHINYVWSENKIGRINIYWNQLDTLTLDLRGEKLISYDRLNPEQPNDDFVDFQPNIDTDFDSCESYITWVRMDAEVYSIIDYTHLTIDGKDGARWEVDEDVISDLHKIHEIGDPEPITSLFVSRIRYPQISHRSNLQERDTVNADYPTSTCGILWVVGDENDGYQPTYTEITQDGRELFPDFAYKDGFFNGFISIDTVLPIGDITSNLDSGFETVNNKLFDNTGKSKFIVWEASNNLDLYSASEIWSTPNQHFTFGGMPDNCVDSHDDVHITWDWVGDIRYNKYVDGIRQYNPDITIFHDPDQSAISPRILYTNTIDEGERITFIWAVYSGEPPLGLYFAQYDINGNELVAPTTLGCYGNLPAGWTIKVPFDVAFDDRANKIHVVYIGLDGNNDYLLRHGSISLDNQENQASNTIENSGEVWIAPSIDVGRDSNPVIVYSEDGDLFYQRISKELTGERCEGSRSKIHDYHMNGYAMIPDIKFDEDINRRMCNVQYYSTFAKNDENLHIVYMVMKEDDNHNPNVLQLHYMRIRQVMVEDEIVPEIVCKGCILAPDYRNTERSITLPGTWFYPEIALDKNNNIHAIYADLVYDFENNYNLPFPQVLMHVKFDINRQLLTSPQILQQYHGTPEPPVESFVLSGSVCIDSKAVVHSIWANNDRVMFISNTMWS